MIVWYWLSSERMTVAVATRHSVIIETPPIVRRFLSQPLGMLKRWMGRQPGFQWELIR